MTDTYTATGPFNAAQEPVNAPSSTLQGQMPQQGQQPPPGGPQGPQGQQGGQTGQPGFMELIHPGATSLTAVAQQFNPRQGAGSGLDQRPQQFNPQRGGFDHSGSLTINGVPFYFGRPPPRAPFMPLIRPRPPSEWGRDDSVTTQARKYPGVSPDPGMPQSSDMRGLLQSVIGMFIRNGSRGVRLGGLGMGSAIISFLAAYQKGHTAKMKEDYDNLKRNWDIADHEQEQLSLEYGAIFERARRDPTYRGSDQERNDIIAVAQKYGDTEKMIPALDRGFEAAEALASSRDIAFANSRRGRSQVDKLAEKSEYTPADMTKAKGLVDHNVVPTGSATELDRVGNALQALGQERGMSTEEVARHMARLTSGRGRDQGGYTPAQMDAAKAWVDDGVAPADTTPTFKNGVRNAIHALGEERGWSEEEVRRRLAALSKSDQDIQSAAEDYAERGPDALREVPQGQRDAVRTRGDEILAGEGINTRQKRQDYWNRTRATTAGAVSGGRAAGAAIPQVERAVLQNQERANSVLNVNADRTLSDIGFVERMARTVDSTGMPILERYMRDGEAALGDPNVAAFYAQISATQKDIMRTLTTTTQGGVLTVSAQNEGRELLSRGATPDIVYAVRNVIERDFLRRITAGREESNRIRRRIPGQEGNMEGPTDLEIRFRDDLRRRASPDDREAVQWLEAQMQRTDLTDRDAERIRDMKEHLKSIGLWVE